MVAAVTDCTSFECSCFGVIAQPVIQGETGPNLPRVLDIETVNVVLRADSARTYAKIKLARYLVGRIKSGVFTEVELLEKTKIRKVTDVVPGLDDEIAKPVALHVVTHVQGVPAVDYPIELTRP